MLVVTIVAARWTVLRLSVPIIWSARLEMGGMALALMLIAEFGPKARCTHPRLRPSRRFAPGTGIADD